VAAGAIGMQPPAGAVRGYSAILTAGPFRRLWLGESVSVVGDAATEIAVVLLAARLGSGARAEAIGLAAAAYVLPGVLSGLLLARAISRASPRTLVAFDAGWRAACLAAITGLAVSGALSLAAYVCLLALASLTRPAGLAGQRALVKALTTRDALLRANALVATSAQFAAIAGPLVAGIGSSLAGPEYVLLLDASTFAVYAAVAASLPAAASETGEPVPAVPGPRVARALSSPLAAAFTLTFAFYLLYGPTVVALPLRAESMAGSFGISGALMLSLLWTAFGIGGAVGALSRGRKRPLGLLRSAVAIVGVWGCATVVLGVTNLAVAGVLAMAVGGGAYAPYPALMATILQRESRSEGELVRLGSLWGSMTSAAAPLGVLCGGALLVPALGASRSLAVVGGVMVLLCVAIRGIYRSSLNSPGEVGPAST
jgi:MFS transporter, DHA3 family, macrolide efflux protein